MKTRKREIAKAGIFGSLDNPTIVTDKDLREIAETFPDIKAAPVKLGGHYCEDRPRLASVTAVSYDEKTQTLSATISEQDALADAVDSGGYYPEVSIGAKQRASDGKMYLHHLAYLGDEPPAVKDLETSLAQELAAAEQNTPAATLAAADAAADIFLRLFPGTTAKRLYLSDTPAQECGAQKQNPLVKENTTGTGENPAAAQPTAGTSPVPENPTKEMYMTELEIEALKTENATLKAQSQTQEKLLADSFKKRAAAEREALVKAADGKIPAAEKEKLLALCDSFATDGRTIALADGTPTPAAVLTEIFAALPLPAEPGVLNLSDPAPADKGSSCADLARRMMAAL